MTRAAADASPRRCRGPTLGSRAGLDFHDGCHRLQVIGVPGGLHDEDVAHGVPHHLRRHGPRGCPSSAPSPRLPTTMRFFGLSPAVSSSACAGRPATSRCSKDLSCLVSASVTTLHRGARAASAASPRRAPAGGAVVPSGWAPHSYAVTTTSLAWAACATSAAWSTANRTVGCRRNRRSTWS